MGPRRALLSVHDKSGIVPFASGLSTLGFELVSTGGTAKVLGAAGLTVLQVSELTGFPEILEGRVKSLHPAIHAGILARRNRPDDLQTLEQHGIRPIDLVAVNLYPFEEAKAAGAQGAALLEWIDIGGPSLVRAAAKNYPSVLVVVDPRRYDQLLAALRTGVPEHALRRELAQEAFAHCARYDASIAAALDLSTPTEEPEGARRFPGLYIRRLGKLQDLRYGENKHQRAAYYQDLDAPVEGLVAARQLGGKELSYNNLLDTSDALSIVAEFSQPAVAVIKHTNPCAVALATEIEVASARAFAADPKSAFGSVVALNREVTLPVATAWGGLFLEVIIAPSFERAALEILQAKKNLRLLELPTMGQTHNDLELRSIAGGLLIQTVDRHALTKEQLTTVSARAPTEAQVRDLLFAWRVCKHVKSNAIVLAREEGTVGIGAGQMSRVDSVELAIRKAGYSATRELLSRGTVLASDAFFPFRDGVDAAAAGGIAAIIHPGGSIRDAEVIAAADEHDIAMVFCGVRGFRH